MPRARSSSMPATALQIEAFPAAKLDAARDLLAKGHARLVRGAKRVGQSAPPAPQIQIDRSYTKLFCTTCKRGGGDAGAWRAAPEGSLARQWGDCAPCDPLGMGTGCQGHMAPRDLVDVSVDAGRPALTGWEFLAVVEPLTGGNLLRQVPGAIVADGELIGWREGIVHCDHCGTKRDRKETFILRATGEDSAIAAGTYKQVGRQCLADFLGGQSPAQIVWLLSIERALRACGEDDGGWSGGGRGRQSYDLPDFLTWTAAVVRVSGWTSRTKARAEEQPSTADLVQYLLTPPFGGGQAVAHWNAARAKYAPGKSDEDRGVAALAWAKALPGNSDYERNLSLIARQDRLDPKHAGILASAIAAYDRELGRRAEQTVTRSDVVSAHVGTIGDRLTMEVTVLRVADVDTDYGSLHIHTMRDASGNAIVWKTTSKRLDVGWSGAIKGTVKKHSEYRGEQQTELSRVAEPKVKEPKVKKAKAKGTRVVAAVMCTSDVTAH
jgi:hypothetical protein